MSRIWGNWRGAATWWVWMSKTNWSEGLRSSAAADSSASTGATSKNRPKPGHLDRLGREPPAHRHAARQRAIELDADRDDPRSARPRRRSVGELDRHDREDRAGVVGQIRQRLAVEDAVRKDRAHRPLVHV